MGTVLEYLVGFTTFIKTLGYTTKTIRHACFVHSQWVKCPGVRTVLFKEKQDIYGYVSLRIDCATLDGHMG